MSQKTIERPTLPEAAQRNPAVKQTQVEKYMKVVEVLRANGVIEKPSYGIQAPLSGRGNIGQSTQASTLRNF